MNSNHCLPNRFLIASLMAVFLLVLTGASGVWAEIYTSKDSKDPKDFYNNGFDTMNNDMQHMDAVYFGGREIILFTLFSNNTIDLYNWLYIYTPGYDYNVKVDIGNSPDLNFRITTCVFNDVLYIFYTGSTSYGTHTNTNIYYRTVTLDTGTTGKDWKLVFSEEHSYSADVSPATILYAGVMNGTLYVHFSSGKNWYVTSSADGVTFGSKTNIYYASEGLYGPGGAVFQVPDTDGGFVERMMLAYCPKSATHINYFFFDGTTAYGGNSCSTPNLYPRSVRLLAGSAETYNNTLYSVQVFFAYPDDDGTDKKWSRIYHSEYIPAGANGDGGYWFGPFNYLSNDSKDHIHCYDDYGSDERWSIIPSYTDEDNNVRTSLNIWYARGTDYSWPTTDSVTFRASSYKSDLIVYEGEQNTPPGNQSDLSVATVIGIIEGTPPFPVNGGIPTYDSSNTSAMEMSTSTDNTFSTSWSVGCAMVFSIGHTFKKIGATLQAKFSAGLKYSEIAKTSNVTSTTFSYRTFLDTPPGDLGWAMVFMPEIINDQYVLESYDKHTLVYSGDTNDVAIRANLIQYGPNSKVEPWAYYLDDPSYPIGGTNNYTGIFEGMAVRPLSTDIDGWIEVTTGEYSQGDTSFSQKNLSVDLFSTQGETTTEKVLTATTTGDTYSPTASFTASASKLGFINWSVEGTVNFSMDISTQTTMTNSLGFWLNVPECCDPRYKDCTGFSCSSSIDDVPILLIPADDDTGYSAPWISNDIRNTEKPKPWCLSYLVYPSESATAATLERFSIKNTSATLYLDQGKSNRDKISAEVTLKGLAEDFSLRDLNLLHFRIGNYVINPATNKVTRYALMDKKIILKLEEPGNPNASILLLLSYNPVKSLLKIDVAANGIDLSDLAPYLTSGGDSGGAPDTVPINIVLGDKYYARDNLAADIGIYENKIKCTLRGDEQ